MTRIAERRVGLQELSYHNLSQPQQKKIARRVKKWTAGKSNFKRDSLFFRAETRFYDSARSTPDTEIVTIFG